MNCDTDDGTGAELEGGSPLIGSEHYQLNSASYVFAWKLSLCSTKYSQT